jgi:hypothetical protein
MRVKVQDKAYTRWKLTWRLKPILTRKVHCGVKTTQERGVGEEIQTEFCPLAQMRSSNNAFLEPIEE